MSRPTAFVSFLLAGGTALAAQQSAGPLAGSPLAIAVEGGANGAADAAVHVHRSGFGSALVQFPATAVNPPNLQAILAQYGAPNLDVDDISTGRDDVMVDANGVIDPPPNGWAVLSLSFRAGAQGVYGSRLAAEPATDRGAAVFSWVLPGSAIPVALTGTVERSHSRAELAVPAGGDVDSLDQPLVLGLNQSSLNALEPGFQSLIQAPQSIYFTVGSSSLALVPASWWISGGVPTPHSGATIFRTLRSSQTGTWSQPQVFKTWFEIGVPQAADIDALAYDEVNEKLLFSCVGNAVADQLMFVDLGTDLGVPVPVTKPDSTPVSQAVGTAGGDDIDAVCTLDPQIRSGLYLPDDFGASCGTPRDAYLPNLYPVGVSASAFRRFDGTGSHYDTWMIGWPPQTGPGPGWAILAITIGDALQPAFTVGLFPRSTTSAIPGDPKRFTQAIPPAFVLSGMPLTFRWFATDAGATEIVQAYPIKVFL